MKGIIALFAFASQAEANACVGLIDKYLASQNATEFGAGGPSLRTQMMTAAKALLAKKTKYTQDSVKRWNGITKKIRPPDAPVWSDCSSAVSWIYWTVFGGGSDILNGQSWQSGYTGTQVQHGKKIAKGHAQHGDLVFYGGTASVPEHVAMWAGEGYVVSHGSEQAQCLPIDYRSDRQQVRCYMTTDGHGDGCQVSLDEDEFEPEAEEAVLQVNAHPASFIAKKWTAVGGPNHHCPHAVSIALAESGGDCNAKGYNSDSVDRGLWQINSKWHSEVSDSCAYDCACNAEKAYKISSKGTDWTPWSTFNNGAYKNHMDAAKTACKSVSAEMGLDDGEAVAV